MAGMSSPPSTSHGTSVPPCLAIPIGHKNVNEKLCSFFVNDLLNAKFEEGFYSHRGIRFCSVYLHGDIISCDWTPKADKRILTIDDGTGSIRCMIPDESKQDLAEIEQNQKLIKMYHNQLDVALSQNNEEQILKLKATLLLLRNTVELLESRCHTNYKFGDTIKVSGKLRNYGDSRYIFATSIEKDNNLNHYVSYLNDVLNFYENDVLT